MGYVNPNVSDAQFIKSDAHLRRRQADEDYRTALSEGEMDAAVFESKGAKRAPLTPGFRSIPGASRSGAIEPRIRSKMLRDEQAGLIELQRSEHGSLVGWRPLDADEP